MATIEQFLSWVERDLSRFANLNDHVERVFEDSAVGSAPTGIRIRIYTDRNRYTISAHANTVHGDDRGYLGCVATNRKPRAGEDWSRGNDLADGKLEEETWRRILADIVSYEMVRLSKTALESASDQTSGTADAGVPRPSSPSGSAA